jgi:hypothetical protein
MFLASICTCAVYVLKAASLYWTGYEHGGFFKKTPYADIKGADIEISLCI